MTQVENVPTIVAGVTLVAGTVLAVAPQVFTGPVGLEDQDLAVRAVGVADLILVPGLYGGRPRWPWMVGRAALSLAQAAYCDGVAPRAKKSGGVRAAAVMLLGLTVMDGSTAVQLRRAGV
jgi:hypothetical protein